MELYYGALNKIELSKIKSGLSVFEIVDVDQNISQCAVELIERYSKSHDLRIPDALIAATVIENELSLLTYNVKDFRYISGLSLAALS